MINIDVESFENLINCSDELPSIAYDICSEEKVPFSLKGLLDFKDLFIHRAVSKYYGLFSSRDLSLALFFGMTSDARLLIFSNILVFDNPNTIENNKHFYSEDFVFIDKKDLFLECEEFLRSRLAFYGFTG